MAAAVPNLSEPAQATGATERASAQVRGYRAMRSSLGDATTAMRAALRRRFAAARQESQRLATAVGRQRRALIDQARALRQSAVDVRRLNAEEARLGETLRQQAAYRDRLASRVAAGAAARSRRESLRGDVVEAGALGFAMLRPLQAVVGKAVEFEEKMADVGKVVDFPAPGGLRAMGKDLLALSKRMPVTAAGFAEIVAAAGQLGIARADLLQFAQGAATMGVAFDLTALEAGQAMAGLRNVFQLGQDGVMDLAGAYNHLSNNMAATAPGLLDIANRVGSTGREVGLTGQQLGALGATLLAMQTPPEVAATSIKSMLITLGAATGASKEARTALDGIGLSAEGVEKAMRIDAETAIVDLLEAVSKSDNVLGTLSKLFGREHAGEIAKLVGGLEEYSKARRLASAADADASSLLREYDARAATTANALTILGNRASGLAINLGSALLPGINAALEPLGAVVDVAAALADRFPGLTTAVVGLAVGLVGAKIAAVAFRYAAASAGETSAFLGGMLLRLRRRLAETALAHWVLTGSLQRTPAVGATAAGGLGRVTRSLRTLRLAIVSTGVGALVVGVGWAVSWLIRHWDGVKAFLAGFARGLGQVADALGPVGDAIRAVGDVVGDVFEWFGTLFAPVDQSAEQLEQWGDAGVLAGRRIGEAITLLATPLLAVGGLIGAATAALGGDWAAAKRRMGFVGDTLGRRMGFAEQQPAAVQPAAPALGAAASAEQPAAEQPAAPAPSAAAFAAPLHASTSNVRVDANITVNPPPGADEQEIAREVSRQLAAHVRRAEVEAGLGESDA